MATSSLSKNGSNGHREPVENLPSQFRLKTRGQTWDQLEEEVSSIGPCNRKKREHFRSIEADFGDRKVCCRLLPLLHFEERLSIFTSFSYFFHYRLRLDESESLMSSSNEEHNLKASLAKDIKKVSTLRKKSEGSRLIFSE